MSRLLKPTIFFILLAVVFTIGVVVVVAVNNRGNAPVAYWKFDEGAGPTAYDSASTNHGTITNALWKNESECKFGKCLYFDGNGDLVSIGTGPNAAQTVSFWVKPLNTTNYFIDLNGSAYISASAGVLSATGFTLPTIYVNGIQTTTIIANSWQYVSVTTSTAINASTLNIGKISTNYLNGFFDDVRIYNYARTATQIKSDYLGGASRGVAVITNNQETRNKQSEGLVGHYKMDETAWTNNCSTATVLDASGNSKTGKSCPATTGPVGGAAGKYGNSGLFDGNDDYVEILDIDF